MCKGTLLRSIFCLRRLFQWCNSAAPFFGYARLVEHICLSPFFPLEGGCFWNDYGIMLQWHGQSCGLARGFCIPSSTFSCLSCLLNPATILRLLVTPVFLVTLRGEHILVGFLRSRWACGGCAPPVFEFFRVSRD